MTTAGAVDPHEFYVYKPALTASRPAILKRALAEKAIAMRYTGSDQVGGTTVFEDVRPRRGGCSASRMPRSKSLPVSR